TTLGVIPQGVLDVGNAFDSCTKIRGILTVNCNPENYNGFLNDTASATSLDLQGDSLVLDVLAATSGQNENITVNGKTPDWEADYNEIMEADAKTDANAETGIKIKQNRKNRAKALFLCAKIIRYGPVIYHRGGR